MKPIARLLDAEGAVVGIAEVVGAWEGVPELRFDLPTDITVTSVVLVTPDGEEIIASIDVPREMLAGDTFHCMIRPDFTDA